jgi:hypothetical protein
MTDRCLLPTPSDPRDGRAWVFLFCGDGSGPLYPVAHPISDHGDQDPLEQVLGRLLSGPRPHRAEAGLWTGFDIVSEYSDLDIAVTYAEDGTVAVSFDLDGRPSTLPDDANPDHFIEPVLATVFQFPFVTAVDLSAFCRSFCPDPIPRSDWEASLAARGVRIAEGCDAVTTWNDPACAAWEMPQPCPADAVDLVLDATPDGNDVIVTLRAESNAPEPCLIDLNAGFAAEGPDAGTATGNPAEVRLSGVVPPWEEPSYWLSFEEGFRLDAAWIIRNACAGITGLHAWTDDIDTRIGFDQECSVAQGPIRLVELSRHSGGRYPDAADLALADAFVDFVRNGAAFPNPAPNGVAVGLGPHIERTIPPGHLADSTAWEISGEWRAYAGVFSALEPPSRDGDFTVSVGPHRHCASVPVEPPAGFEDHHRVSIQPAAYTIDSCLAWWTVDLFVATDGTVAAVTHDFWEP